MVNLIGQQMGNVSQYDKAKYLLETGCAIIVFRKKSGELRTMLCTRNFNTATLFDFDARINSRTNAKLSPDNVVVTDLIIGETRQILLSNVMWSAWFSIPTTKDDVDTLIRAFNYVKDSWSNYDELSPIYQDGFKKSFALS